MAYPCDDHYVHRVGGVAVVVPERRHRPQNEGSLPLAGDERVASDRAHRNRHCCGRH